MRYSKYLLISTIVLVVFGCASKKFAKQANKYAEAGLYQDAAEMYYRSVIANDKNIEAKMGLQRNGQLLLEQKLSLFKTQYDNKAVKEAVYAYIDADQYFQKVNSAGVRLLYPSEYKVYYDEVKEQYLESRYNEALKALDVDEFSGAEIILSEILQIDAAYKDSKTHWITAKYEPIYRRGNVELDNQLYRTAYYSFDQIIKGTGTYKDAIQNKALALDKAMITIAVAPFYMPYTSYSNVTQNIRAQIIKDLNQINSPFYKTIADQVVASLPASGKKSRVFDLIPFISAYSQSITAKAILTANVSRYVEDTGNLIVKEKKGYLKVVEEYVDVTSGEKKTKTSYNKTIYKEFTQENNITMLFEYSLIDVATGTIFVSDVFNISKESNIHYATFQGDIKNLIPGYWKEAGKESPGDVVSDNQNSINELNSLLKSGKEIRSIQSLTQESVNEISSSLVRAIEKYNPEK